MIAFKPSPRAIKRLRRSPLTSPRQWRPWLALLIAPAGLALTVLLTGRLFPARRFLLAVEGPR